MNPLFQKEERQITSLAFCITLQTQNSKKKKRKKCRVSQADYNQDDQVIFGKMKEVSNKDMYDNITPKYKTDNTKYIHCKHSPMYRVSSAANTECASLSMAERPKCVIDK
jgi:hypothetical protein